MTEENIEETLKVWIAELYSCGVEARKLPANKTWPDREEMLEQALWLAIRASELPEGEGDGMRLRRLGFVQGLLWATGLGSLSDLEMGHG